MKRILICLTLLFLFIVGCEAPSMEDEVIKAVENNTEWKLEFKPGTKMNERTFVKWQCYHTI
jgi:PBP1b-binding outer membrane lipoprotein LpoB